jgi:hypothetical protein
VEVFRADDSGGERVYPALFAIDGVGNRHRAGLSSQLCRQKADF